MEKVAAAHLLEALRVVLDHLRDFTLSQQNEPGTGGRNAASTYAHARRLRTYLQRSLSAATERIEVDFNEDDRNLLAAVAIFELANLDRKLNGPRGQADEVAWLEERRRVLSHWAVTFATRKVDHIPAADDGALLTASAQAALREIQRRIVAEGQRSGLHRVTPGIAGMGAVPGGTFQPGGAEQTRRPVARSFGIPPPQAHAVAAPAGPEPGGRPVRAGGGVPHVPPEPQAADEGDADVQGNSLDLDPRRLHDPRVRAVLQLDLRAFERAVRANDHRLCVVHLGSILEACCLDWALARRRELGLPGAPESWNLEVLLHHVFGSEVSSMDRALLFHLTAARNLLRPAIQVSNPMVITAATQAELTQFVLRVLAAMGYVGAGEPLPLQSQPAAPTPPVRPAGSVPSWMR